MEVFKLYCNKTLIGVIKEPFECDDTWYGTFEMLLKKGNDDFENRIIDFIEFSKKWNHEIETNIEEPPDVYEFDKFDEIINKYIWFVESNKCTVCYIDKAPNFYDDEVSWRLSIS